MTPRVSEETAREHVTNAYTALDTYRQVNGGDWHRALNNPSLHIAELAALLESVETRLKLALSK